MLKARRMTICAVLALISGCASYQTYRTTDVATLDLSLSRDVIIQRFDQMVKACWSPGNRFLYGQTVIRRYELSGGNTALDVSTETDRFKSPYEILLVGPTIAGVTHVRIRETTTVYSDKYRGFSATVMGWLQGSSDCGARQPGK